MAFPLETNRSDEALDFGCLVSLRFAFFDWEWATDDILSDVVFLAKVIEFSDFSNSLRSKTPRHCISS